MAVKKVKDISTEKEIQKQLEKQNLINAFNKIKQEFLNIEKTMCKNFSRLSLNDVFEFKKSLSIVEGKMKKIALELNKKHKMKIDLENRSFLNVA